MMFCIFLFFALVAASPQTWNIMNDILDQWMRLISKMTVEPKPQTSISSKSMFFFWVTYLKSGISNRFYWSHSKIDILKLDLKKVLDADQFDSLGLSLLQDKLKTSNIFWLFMVSNSKVSLSESRPKSLYEQPLATKIRGHMMDSSKIYWNLSKQ